MAGTTEEASSGKTQLQAFTVQIAVKRDIEQRKQAKD